MAESTFGVAPLVLRHCIVAAALALATATGAAARPCTPDEATAADALVDQLDTWDQVHVAYVKYRHCDDGSISEGTSEAISRLLVDQWQTLPRLSALIRRDPAFRAFVLRHIDSTLTTDDLDKIKALAHESCPSTLSGLCAAVAAAAAKSAPRPRPNKR